jgi:L-asparaginase
MAAGAKGIVAAAFAPGMLAPAEAVVYREAADAGIVVVVSSRAGSGRTFPSSKIVGSGFLTADNLTPQKARILLSLALTRTSDRADIKRIFATY